MEFASLVKLLTDAGAVAALVLVVAGGMRGDYVWRGTHETLVSVWRERHHEAVEEATWLRGRWMDAEARYQEVQRMHAELTRLRGGAAS